MNVSVAKFFIVMESRPGSKKLLPSRKMQPRSLKSRTVKKDFKSLRLSADPKKPLRRLWNPFHGSGKFRKVLKQKLGYIVSKKGSMQHNLTENKKGNDNIEQMFQE